MNHYDLLLKRIDEIQFLEENWNGYGTDSIPLEVITRAKNFIFYLKDLSEFISIFPTAWQSIQIEFDKDGVYCEAEIFSDVIGIYAEQNDVEYKNEQFNSIEVASVFYLNIITDF